MNSLTRQLEEGMTCFLASPGRVGYLYVMAALSKIAQVQLERKKLEDELVTLRAMIAEKETRISDLIITERVLSDLSGNKADEPELSPKVEEPEEKKPAWTRERSKKPHDTPSVPEMILAVLRDAQADLKKGRRGLEPKEIAAEIAKRWWPEVTINAVGPIAWRMYKRGDLQKRSSRYFTPKTDEPPIEAIGPIQSTGVFN